jgi:diguanylate cyclase (GGDEF)-like protein
MNSKMNNNQSLYRVDFKQHQLMRVLFISFSIIMLINSNKAIAENQSPEKQSHNLSQENNVADISATLLKADKIRRANPQLFQQLMTDLELVKEQFTIEQLSYHLFLQGYFFTYRGQYTQAEKSFNDLLNSDASFLLKFRANYTLINVAGAQKNWSKGLRHVAINKKSLPKISNTEHYQGSLLTEITFYNQLRQYQLVLKNIEKLEQQELSPVYTCFLKQFRLEAKLNLEQLKSTDAEVDAAIDICQQAGNKIGANIIRIYKSRLYLKESIPSKSLDLLLPFKNEINNTIFSPLISGMNNNLAKAFLQLRDIENAKFYATKALETNVSDTIIQQSIDSYELLYEVAKQQKNISLALRHHEKYSELDRAHLEGEKAKHLAFQLAEHQAFEQESQIKLLNEKNNALAAEQSLAKTQAANRKLIILLLGLVILAFTFVGIRFCRSHKRVKELAEYDPLTGIYNRGHFTHVTNSALKYCKNAQQDLSVIMFDLDHFKKVNDSFGHACGDWALKETIKVCQNIGRKNDIFARLGGEEFCLVLTSCTIDVAMLRAEACRAAIEEIITEESGCEFSITASFGVTDLKRSGFNLDKLLADADMAAYASKNAGRNRVTMFEVPETSQPKKLDNSWNYEK